MPPSSDTPELTRSMLMSGINYSGNRFVSESERKRRQAIREAYLAGVPLKIISKDHNVHKSMIYHFCRDLPRRQEQFKDRKIACTLRFTPAEMAAFNKDRGKLPLATYLRKRITRP